VHEERNHHEEDVDRQESDDPKQDGEELACGGAQQASPSLQDSAEDPPTVHRERGQQVEEAEDDVEVEEV